MKYLLITALLILTQPALAQDKVYTKRVDSWGITNSGDLYLKTKKGTEYVASLDQCPTEIVQGFEVPNVYVDGRFLHNGKTIHFYDRLIRGKNKIRCIVGEIRIV